VHHGEGSTVQTDRVGPTVTLQDAASQLGVHYMTAYRYVRLGQLPATKAAGVWQVRAEDLETFRAGQRSAVEPAEGVPTVRGRVRRAPWAQRLEQRLMAGDTAGSWAVIEAAMKSGFDIDDCYLEVLAPAMRSIGDRWARNEIDVAVEHLASSVASRLIGRLGARTYRRGRSRGSVLLGAAAGERHSLPVAVLADLVRLAGWEVVDLGADVPIASFVHAARTVGPELVAVGISVTTPAGIDAARSSIHHIRAVVPPTVLVIVGGLAITSRSEALAIGADGSASDGRGFVELLDAATPGGTGAG
jgi:excisionase family DNA binding protein